VVIGGEHGSRYRPGPACPLPARLRMRGVTYGVHVGGPRVPQHAVRDAWSGEAARLRAFVPAPYAVVTRLRLGSTGSGVAQILLVADALRGRRSGVNSANDFSPVAGRHSGRPLFTGAPSGWQYGYVPKFQARSRMACAIEPPSGPWMTTSSLATRSRSTC